MIRKQAIVRDAVIVGAGAAGAYFAAKLAAAGKSVLVLEAGPAWNMGDFKSSMIWARRLRWGGAPVEMVGTDSANHGFNMGWGLGGTAIHHFSVWPRLATEDFEMRSRFGRGLDWPVSYDELRPWYDRIQKEVGISGDAAAESPWREEADPYPMGPIKAFAAHHILARGFDAMGIAHAPLPLAINSTDYGGRAACMLEGWCDPGCPVGALYNPLVKDIPEAIAAGAEFRTHATVTRLVTDDDGKLHSLKYVDGDGAEHEISAEVFILAGGNLHNARLLLASPSAAHPKGLSNANGMVGKYFMTHPMVGCFGMFEAETENHLGVTGGTLTSRADYGKGTRDSMFGAHHWLGAQAVKPNDLLGIAMSRVDLFGADLEAFMQRAARHLIPLTGMLEGLPVASNTIELKPEKDRHGVPLLRVTHAFEDDTRRLIAYVQARGLEIMNAAGAVEAWNGNVGKAHLMGGTVMGADAGTSVCDGYGRTHEVQNLLLAGAGNFPTSGAVNPTFTIYALAARTIDHMLANWSDYTA